MPQASREDYPPSSAVLGNAASLLQVKQAPLSMVKKSDCHCSITSALMGHWISRVPGHPLAPLGQCTGFTEAQKSELGKETWEHNPLILIMFLCWPHPASSLSCKMSLVC